MIRYNATVTAGVLFLLAILTYATGNSLVTDALHQNAAGPRMAVGALLMLLNSVCVVGMGILLAPSLRRHSEHSARTYFIARLIEAVLLAAGVVLLLLSAQADSATAALLQRGNFYCYQTGMMALGVGGTVMALAWYRTRQVPRWLALWGGAGYALLLAGAVAELLGQPLGMLLAAPGGLFEVFIAFWLIFRSGEW